MYRGDAEEFFVEMLRPFQGGAITKELVELRKSVINTDTLLNGTRYGAPELAP